MYLFQGFQKKKSFINWESLTLYKRSWEQLWSNLEKDTWTTRTWCLFIRYSNGTLKTTRHMCLLFLAPHKRSSFSMFTWFLLAWKVSKLGFATRHQDCRFGDTLLIIYFLYSWVHRCEHAIYESFPCSLAFGHLERFPC